MNIDDAKIRAIHLANRIKDSTDRQMRQILNDLNCPESKYAELADIGIHEDAWNYILKEGIEPKLVFAHPETLKQHPQTSMHYRGISTLSFKRVVSIAVNSVKRWEDGTLTNPSMKDCRKLACLYNTVISTIIMNTISWTLENGYRNILATLGISIDGSMRNIVGVEGEVLVRNTILDFLNTSDSVRCEKITLNKEYLLEGKDITVRMTFSSEPDVNFERKTDKGWETVSTIEVKAGTDPAGALERLGSIVKSFKNTPKNSKNFAVLGVITTEMQARLDEISAERHFKMDMLKTEAGKAEFLKEIFHHALRLTE